MAFFNKDKSIPNDQQWERSVLEKVALASVIEQRRTRRWNIFFKLLLLTYIIFISSLAMSPMSDVSTLSKGLHTAMVDVKGIIVSGGEADAESIIKSLKNAVKDPNTKGIVLRVNSPGGSPVQSSYVMRLFESSKILTQHYQSMRWLRIYVPLAVILSRQRRIKYLSTNLALSAQLAW